MVLLHFSCSKPQLRLLNGSIYQASDDIEVYFFLNTECPICLKYQGEYQNFTKPFKKIKTYYVFFGSDTKENVLEFSKYDSLPLSQVIWDQNYVLYHYLKPEITPQVIILKNKKEVYSGKLDDRFESLGSFKPESVVNYIKNTLVLLLNNEEIKISNTEPVGCFIEPN